MGLKVMLWGYDESYNKKEREMENLMFLQYTGNHLLGFNPHSGLDHRRPVHDYSDCGFHIFLYIT